MSPVIAVVYAESPSVVDFNHDDCSWTPEFREELLRDTAENLEITIQ
ncbi:MAG: hypothetical protein ACT4OY_06970 [Alphaproteobacteria bacterium]